MQQIFGNFVERDTASQEYSAIHFSPTSILLQQRWRNNGSSADLGHARYFVPAQVQLAQRAI